MTLSRSAVGHRPYFNEGWSFIPPNATMATSRLPWTGATPDPRLFTGDTSEEYRLDRVIGKYVVSVSGLGLPPITYPTQRGPYQHGETPLDYFLEPRVLQLGIRHRTHNRPFYWGNVIPNPPGAVSAPLYGQGRAGLLNALRPNKFADPTAAFPSWRPGRLRFYYSPLMSSPHPGETIINLSGNHYDPTSVDIDVLVTEALGGIVPTPNSWDSWGFSDVIRFIAHDPLFYNPRRKRVSVQQTGTGNWNVTIDVPYFGTWEEFPVIVVDSADGSALNLATLTLEMQRHSFTRQTIDLLATTGTAGETAIVIDLRYGRKTVLSEPLVVNLLPYLSDDSDLATFSLQPYPIAETGGVNNIEITATGTNLQTRLSVYYYERFLGI